jgi:hypothetical protein
MLTVGFNARGVSGSVVALGRDPIEWISALSGLVVASAFIGLLFAYINHETSLKQPTLLTRF